MLIREKVMLNKGDSFSGFRVEAETDTNVGKVWIFSKGNEAVVIGCSWEELFAVMTHPEEKERFLDQLAMELHRKYRDNHKTIRSLDTE